MTAKELTDAIGMPVAEGAEGQGIGVGFMGPGTTIPIAKIKALFEKASARIG